VGVHGQVLQTGQHHDLALRQSSMDLFGKLMEKIRAIFTEKECRDVQIFEVLRIEPVVD
jgi:hypothetical protein